MVTLRDILGVLLRYRGRYRWLEVRASDVLELNDDESEARFEPAGVQT